MTEVTLEPCPLCNGHAVMWEDGDPKYPWCVTFEHADECPLYAVPTDFFRSYPTEAEAAAAWNQRHTRPASTEPADALPDRNTRLGSYLANEAASRAMMATLPSNVRDRIEAWQTHQSEWFSATLLEVVSEFIRFDDTTRTDALTRRPWCETCGKDVQGEPK